ncbi:MAG: hypothetical protein Q3M30_18650 [Candidatus Electrothrix sp. Rat3]|nr:hypothetical protein [Candidatus Electrothrix rattekaaiensis]
MPPSSLYNIPEGTPEIHLIPAQTVSDAIIASVLAIACKIPAYCLLWFIFFMSLSGFLVGCVNIIGHENAYQMALAFQESILPGKTTITLDDLEPFFPSILSTLVVLSIIFETLFWYVTRNNEIEEMCKEFHRRLQRNSILIGGAYVVAVILAIATSPLVDYPEGVTIMSIPAGFAGLYIVALIANVFFVIIDTFAHQLLWHAGVVFRKRFF